MIYCRMRQLSLHYITKSIISSLLPLCLYNGVVMGHRKRYISYLVHTSHFWNSLHQVPSKTEHWKAKWINSLRESNTIKWPKRVFIGLGGEVEKEYTSTKIQTILSVHTHNHASPPLPDDNKKCVNIIDMQLHASI